MDNNAGELYIGCRASHKLRDRIDKHAARMSEGQVITFSRSDIIRIAINMYLAEYEVVEVATLPHPPGAEPDPLVTVQQKGSPE